MKLPQEENDMKVDAPPLEHQVISRAWADTKKGSGDFVSFRDALQTAIARMLWEQKAEITDLKEENERLKALLREARECVNNDIGGQNRFGLLQRIDAEIKMDNPSSEPSSEKQPLQPEL